MNGPGRLEQPAAWDAFVTANDLGSYLQRTAWARVKASNGWTSTRVVAGGVETIGAQVLLRRPRPLPWAFAYAPRGPVASAWTGETLVAFLVALPSETAIVLLARAFYAGRDTRTPVVAALSAVVVSVVISIALAPSLGVVGLALGIAVASWLEALILFGLLGRREPTLDVPGIARGGLVAAACAAVTGVAVWLVLEAGRLVLGPTPGKIGIAGELAVAGITTVAVYLGLARLLRIPEVPMIMRLVSTALRRDPAA